MSPCERFSCWPVGLPRAIHNLTHCQSDTALKNVPGIPLDIYDVLCKFKFEYGSYMKIGAHAPSEDAHLESHKLS